jgi:hypothetical protein
VAKIIGREQEENRQIRELLERVVMSRCFAFRKAQLQVIPKFVQDLTGRQRLPKSSEHLLFRVFSKSHDQKYRTCREYRSIDPTAIKTVRAPHGDAFKAGRHGRVDQPFRRRECGHRHLF